MGDVRVILRIRSDATAGSLDDGRVVLGEGHMQTPLGPLGPGLTGAVSTLADGGATERQLCDAVTRNEDEQAVLKLQLLLRRLQTSGWLERVVSDEDTPLATLRPLGHVVPAAPGALDATRPVVLSRFALMRTAGGEALAESPRAALSVVLHEARLAVLLASLVEPAAPSELDLDGLGLTRAAVLGTLEVLTHARVIVRPGTEDEGPLAQWSLPDLLFHTRSRVGRHVGGYGGTYHLDGRVESPPAVKPVRGSMLALPRPDLERPSMVDAPLSRVLEERRSVREHDDDTPITAGQLGEFLFRSARVRRCFHDGRQELSDRPYPGGGAIYELELYPVVSRCEGVNPGLYHYDPAGHALALVAEPTPAVRLLVEYGRRTAVMEHDPQILLLLAARFGRAMWKYESMAYALVLKDVGVLYQTMYCVATAMGLAPCALGGGNPDGFAAAAGTDYYEESTVGEFVVGSRRDATRST